MVGGWRGLLGLIGKAVNLDGALRLGAVDAEFAGGCVYARWLMLRPGLPAIG